MKERQSASWCFFFRYPITVKKYIMAARMQAVARHRRPFFVIVGINTIWLFQFVIFPINDNNIFRFKLFFDRFLKYLCFFFIMIGGLVNCYVLYVSFSWHVCLKEIGQNVE